MPAAAAKRAAERAPRKTRSRSGGEASAESISIWLRLLRCHAMMLTELRRKLEDRTTLARFELLASLDRDDGQTLAALSRALVVTAGNVTGLVDRAVRDHLKPEKNQKT